MLPDVPTIAEAGLPGYEANNWWGVMAPAGTPPADHREAARRDRGGAEFRATKKQFATEGAEIVQMGSAEFGTFVASEIKKWERVVKEGGIKAE